jgi:hypothetical protein
MTTAPSTVELQLEPPDEIRCGDQTYRSGGTVFRAIEFIVKSKHKAGTVRSLAVAVWGSRVGPEVSKTTVKGLLHRANDVLAGLGARERLSLDGEAVLLV